ncbi:hypothetical protein ACFLU4_01820 [Chloroflexota bacterium]
MPKYGVRIYPLDSQIILIKQTVKREGSGVYVVDTMEDGNHREAHVPIDDDTAIAAAVRDALHGLLLHS